MHLVQPEPAASAAFPDLPAKARLVSKMEGTSNGLPWRVFELAFEYGFIVGGAAQYVGTAEHENAARAEKAARRWCAAFEHEPTFEPAPALEVVGVAAFDAAVFGEADGAVEWDHEAGPQNSVDDAPPAPAPAIEPVGEHLLCGWRVVVGEGRKGTFKAEVFHEVTGDPGALDQADNFIGKATAKEALDAAAVWTMQHPADIAAPLDGSATARGITVSGWHVLAIAGTRGTYAAQLVDASTGEVCGERFDGHMDQKGADLEACEWARENPTPAHRWESEDTHGENIEDEDDARRRDRMEAEKLEHGEESAPAVFYSGDGVEVAELRRQLALAIEQRDAALAGIAADARKGGEDAAEYRRLIGAKRGHLDTIAAAKDAIKGIDVRLGELGIGMVDLCEGLANGTRSAAYQIGLTFDASSSVRASVGAQAGRQAAALSGPIVWAFNGVEHVIETSHESMPDGPRWTAWIKGHRADTEAFHEDEASAIEACKSAASVVFGDCDPGETRPSVDPAVRLPARRGRKPKHDQAAVQAALAGRTTVEAALELGITPQQLVKLAEKYGIAVDAPAPAKRGRKAVQS